MQSRRSRFTVALWVVRSIGPEVYDARGLVVYSLIGGKGLRNGGDRPYSGPRRSRGRVFGPRRAHGGGVPHIHRKEVALRDYGRWEDRGEDMTTQESVGKWPNDDGSGSRSAGSPVRRPPAFTARLRPLSVSGRETLPGASPIRNILITASLSLS